MPRQMTAAEEAKRRNKRAELQFWKDRKLKLVRTTVENGKCVVRVPAETRKQS